ncbi:hypothetical protein HaLaN_09762 [Haematococcus lacustris]|uniref:Uncharacterized protein n=1 Tax=Haematococcus lacustris TaxID=44745 RepID=A0A699ZE61_HAELA|nr:hypothetical protein HaLaN_09762 [Haematococcus lacustris]
MDEQHQQPQSCLSSESRSAGMGPASSSAFIVISTACTASWLLGAAYRAAWAITLVAGLAARDGGGRGVSRQRLYGAQDRALEQFFKKAPRSSQAATQPAASEPGPSTPPPAKRSKRSEAEPAAKPTKGKGKAQGKAAKAKSAPQRSRWLDQDCNAALNMQRIGESRWRPLELCYWPEQGALPAKGKGYPGLDCKRLQDKPPKAQEQQQPAVAP